MKHKTYFVGIGISMSSLLSATFAPQDPKNDNPLTCVRETAGVVRDVYKKGPVEAAKKFAIRELVTLVIQKAKF